ncbi:zinc finger, CCHC-type containing protein [Tanacetum coccineum]|uniref:Zinc finger, CCHC-type containing protein n=1 Tax=Tanacetum coccineum TaxID=301880 RepID=A0ABQ4XF69_9ASTR
MLNLRFMQSKQTKFAYAPNPEIPLPPKKDNPAKDVICHQCGEVGHWRRNCPQYLNELMKTKKLAQGASTSKKGFGGYLHASCIPVITEADDDDTFFLGEYLGMPTYIKKDIPNHIVLVLEARLALYNEPSNETTSSVVVQVEIKYSIEELELEINDIEKQPVLEVEEVDSKSLNTFRNFQQFTTINCYRVCYDVWGGTPDLTSRYQVPLDSWGLKLTKPPYITIGYGLFYAIGQESPIPPKPPKQSEFLYSKFLVFERERELLNDSTDLEGWTAYIWVYLQDGISVETICSFMEIQLLGTGCSDLTCLIILLEACSFGKTFFNELHAFHEVVIVVTCEGSFVGLDSTTVDDPSMCSEYGFGSVDALRMIKTLIYYKDSNRMSSEDSGVSSMEFMRTKRWTLGDGKINDNNIVNLVNFCYNKLKKAIHTSDDVMEVLDAHNSHGNHYAHIEKMIIKVNMDLFYGGGVRCPKYYSSK